MRSKQQPVDEDGRRTARRTAHAAAAGTRHGEVAAGGRGDFAEIEQSSIGLRVEAK